MPADTNIPYRPEAERVQYPVTLLRLLAVSNTGGEENPPPLTMSVSDEREEKTSVCKMQSGR